MKGMDTFARDCIIFFLQGSDVTHNPKGITTMINYNTGTYSRNLELKTLKQCLLSLFLTNKIIESNTNYSDLNIQ